MGVRDRNCKDCAYGCMIFGGEVICEYIFKTGKMRPSPPGDKCTAKIKRKTKRRTKNVKD